jgi:NADH-quinone oxidoreductase subunit N
VDLEFVRPAIDWHAIAPEIVLTGVLLVVVILDLIDGERFRLVMPTVAGVGLLATLVPALTLAVDGTTREMFGGAYVVDDFALVLKVLFIIVGYVVVLLSIDYVRDGDYYENEYYTLLLSSLLGMVIMASSRDLITMFIALELLSIPAYMLAAWRKGGLRSNEAGMKYYLMGVFATAVMLYGMSFVFGAGGSTVFTEISVALSGPESTAFITVGILFVLFGFAFKVSAVPFHTWAPDTYEGAPTPITAFLSVGSKTAGFVALLQLVFVAFVGRTDVTQPLFWILSALTMTVGNLIALRQTNIVRMLAYSGVAQGGFMLAALAVAGDSAQLAMESVVIYLIIYAFMNLGAFAVVMAVARKTRSGEITSYGGLINYAPGLTAAMTVFLFALAGIPPLAGWFAKFTVFRAVIDAGTTAGYALGVIVAVNSVIALVYYANVAKEMWFNPVPDGDETPVPMTGSLSVAIGLTVLATIVFGIVPGVIGHFGEISVLASGP